MRLSTRCDSNTQGNFPSVPTASKNVAKARRIAACRTSSAGKASTTAAATAAGAFCRPTSFEKYTTNKLSAITNAKPIATPRTLPS